MRKPTRRTTTDNRRTEQRRSVFFRTVLIESEMEGEPAEVVNIARAGFLTRTPVVRTLGTIIRLRLPIVGERNAVVVWCANGLLGGRFDNPIDEDSFARLLGTLT